MKSQVLQHPPQRITDIETRFQIITVPELHSRDLNTNPSVPVTLPICRPVDPLFLEAALLVASDRVGRRQENAIMCHVINYIGDERVEIVLLVIVVHAVGGGGGHAEGEDVLPVQVGVLLPVGAVVLRRLG